MRIVRLGGRLPGGDGVCLAREGVSAQGRVSAQGGLPGGCLPGQEGGGVHLHSGGQDSWHMLVKTLSFRNFICGR